MEKSPLRERFENKNVAKGLLGFRFEKRNISVFTGKKLPFHLIWKNFKFCNVPSIKVRDGTNFKRGHIFERKSKITTNHIFAKPPESLLGSRFEKNNITAFTGKNLSMYLN